MKWIALGLALMAAALGLVACGGGGSSTSAGSTAASNSTADSTSKPASSPAQEIEERCGIYAEELRANPSEAAAWKETLEGCREDVKDAEEPARVAREEKANELRIQEGRAAYRDEKEARLQAKLRNVKARLRESKRAELEALKGLCSVSVSEVVAEEKQTGHYLREYWRECR